jgi:UDP-N-acetylmuramoyl-tripeptide--D-alanyl-D-alanine ligase
VINDAYNANPTSMRAALDALVGVEAQRRIAVLGLMAELDDPDAAHREVAEYARALGVEVLAVGTDRYGSDPLEPHDVAVVLGPVDAGTAVLVKASRAAGFESIVEALLAS